MKKHLFVPAAAAMFVLVGCSNDEIPAPAGDDGTVTFAVELPASMQGRGYADGSQAKKLDYGVYDATTGELVFASTDEGAVQATGGPIEYQLKLNLVKGKTYDFIFWAATEGKSHYTFNAAEKSVTVNYTPDGDNYTAEGNDDSRDAFFQAVKGVEVKGAMTQPVELRRPFSQLNFGTDDIAAAAAAKTVIKSTSLMVEGAYKTLNLYTGIASDPVTLIMTAEADATGHIITSEDFPADGSYDYLTMDYLLTGSELEGTDPENVDVQSSKRELFNAELPFTFVDNQTATVEVPNMPVQRNYRTNVFGSLLTASHNFIIEVKPGFNDEPGHNFPVLVAWDGTTVTMPTVDDNNKTVAVNAPSDFIGLAQMVNGTESQPAKTFEGYTVTLAGDLDFGGHEIPMIAQGAERSDGNAVGAYFGGVLDGRGATISNFTIASTAAGSTASGFIASLKGENAALRNITFKDVHISSTAAKQTGLVGLLSEGAKVENVHVTSGTVKGVQGTGGIVGRILSKGTVENCSNAADVETTSYNVGGIVGAAYYGNNGMEIKNCTNSGNITAGTVAAGGIVGFNCGDISGCRNSGAVTGAGTSVGGVIGEQQNTGIIYDCHNTGAVTCTTGAYGAGGVVGWIRYSGAANVYTKSVITVDGCTNSAVVSGGTGVAGIAGMIYGYGEVRNCVNTAPALASNCSGFVSGIANQQSDTGSKLPDLPFSVKIIGNISTTPLEQMSTGSMKALFIYINDPSAVTEENNSTTLSATE